MGYNNQLADLWMRYDKARMEDLQWESFTIRMQDKVQEKIREYGAVSNKYPVPIPNQQHGAVVSIQNQMASSQEHTSLTDCVR